jgi:hypothetical protein
MGLPQLRDVPTSLGEVRGSGAANLLFSLFGGAIILTMGALVAFVVEMLLAARGVRWLVDRSVKSDRS